MTPADLKTAQWWSPERKILKTQAKIIEFYYRNGGNVYISFSGGKDSRVLLHIARQIFPDIPAVFCNTGLEYPEVKAFALSQDNVTKIRPNIGFGQVLKKYGYPVISKEVAEAVRLANPGTARYKKIMGLAGAKHYDLSKYAHLLDAPFKISEQCCDVMKHRPFYQYEKETGRKPIIATMACESQLRRTHWLNTGCNAFSGRITSKPMSFWLEQDVLRYLKFYDLDYASVYGDIIPADPQIQFCEVVGEEKLMLTGLQRTGCMFCMFGVHLEKSPNRFERMKITHPDKYDLCINKFGCGKVLDFIGVKY